jgi:predicted ATPase
MQRFSVLYGLWAANYVAGRIEPAQDLALQYIEVANRQSDPTYCMIGQRIVGAGLIAAGRHRDGLLSLNLAEKHYDPARQRPLSYRFGQDIGLAILCHKVWALWFLGFGKQAADLSAKILTELSNHGHATTVAFCTLYGAVFPAIFAADFETASRLGAELTAYCREQKMGPHYVVAGRLCGEIAGGMREPTIENINAIRHDMQTLHQFGVYVLDSPLTAALAQILLAAGDAAGAEVVLDEGINFAESSGELYWLAELHRLKGHVALRQGAPNAVCAAACFTRAIEVARRQEARPLELRAAIDLVRTRQETGSARDAEAMLAMLLDAMEDGEILVEVRHARDLLASIRCP